MLDIGMDGTLCDSLDCLCTFLKNFDRCFWENALRQAFCHCSCNNRNFGIWLVEVVQACEFFVSVILVANPIPESA